MKKIALILIITLASFTAKAQHFGVKLDAGISQINKIYSYLNVKSKPQLYYAIGVFYTKLPVSSKWGFLTSLDFNKRGAKGVYESEWYDDNLGQTYLESKTILSTNSLSVTFIPTLNVSKNLQFFLGPHFNYSLSNKTKATDTYYQTKAKQLVLETFTNIDESNGVSFSDRISYGVKIGANIKLSNHVDIGLCYQYSRLLKYGSPYYQPYYHIVNITTNIYFKSRKNASEN